MATSEKRLYTTGELAKMFSLKKDTLFYYDRIGLFSPKYRKGSTNYRYYDSGQIKTLDTILALRDMDIPINELKSYLKDINTDSFLNLMELENKKLEAKIRDFTIMKKTLVELSRRMKKAKESEYGKLFFKEEDTHHFFSLPIIMKGKNLEEAWNKAYGEFWSYIDSDKIITNGAILPKSNFLSREYTLITHIIGYTVEKNADTTEKGLYANIYIKGSYDNLNAGYEIFHDAIVEAGYYPISDIYEEYIITSLSEEKEENYVTLLRVKVERIAPHCQ